MFGASARLIEPSILDRDDPDDPGEIAAFCRLVGVQRHLDGHQARRALTQGDDFWHTNLAAGFVATPATSTVADIVVAKSGKQFRPTDELWLAIQCSALISETLLPIEGVADFDSVPPLDGFLFSRVFCPDQMNVPRMRGTASRWPLDAATFRRRFEPKKQAAYDRCGHPGTFNRKVP